MSLIRSPPPPSFGSLTELLQSKSSVETLHWSKFISTVEQDYTSGRRRWFLLANKTTHSQVKKVHRLVSCFTREHCSSTHFYIWSTQPFWWPSYSTADETDGFGWNPLKFRIKSVSTIRTQKDLLRLNKTDKNSWESCKKLATNLLRGWGSWRHIMTPLNSVNTDQDLLRHRSDSWLLSDSATTHN